MPVANTPMGSSELDESTTVSGSSATLTSAERLAGEQGTDSPAAFSFVCLGAGGGPFENNCSCYVMKPAHLAWHDGTTLVEGGSFLGSLMTCLEHPENAFYDAELPENLNAEARTEVFNSWIQNVFLTHGHLDHLFGLVLASSNNRVQRPVYGLKDTLDTLLTVFNGRLWPRLASYKESDPMAFYHLCEMVVSEPKLISDDLHVTALPVSHGNTRLAIGTSNFQPVLREANVRPWPCNLDGDIDTMVSTAFLFHNPKRDSDVLFFGDVEPDEVNGMHTNRRLWKKVAPRMAKGKLRAVFLECSFSSEQPTHLLFGHLTPEHLYRELKELASCVCTERNESNLENSLRGLKCVVTHVKGMTLSVDPNRSFCTPIPKTQMSAPLQLPLPLMDIVGKELQELESQGRLGVEFVVARPGMRIGRWHITNVRMLNALYYSI